MILIAVGTDRHEFRRLVQAADDLAVQTDEKIVVQIGRTRIYPKKCEWFKLLNEDEFQKYIEKSRIIITHAGVGLIVSCLKAGKPTIVVPRRKELNEHIDNHQFDIAREMARGGRVVYCEEVDQLKEKIQEAEKLDIKKFGKQEKMISKIIDNQIKQWFSKDLN